MRKFTFLAIILSVIGLGNIVKADSYSKLKTDSLKKNGLIKTPKGELENKTDISYPEKNLSINLPLFDCGAGTFGLEIMKIRLELEYNFTSKLIFNTVFVKDFQIGGTLDHSFGIIFEPGVTYCFFNRINNKENLKQIGLRGGLFYYKFTQEQSALAGLRDDIGTAFGTYGGFAFMTTRDKRSIFYIDAMYAPISNISWYDYDKNGSLPVATNFGGRIGWTRQAYNIVMFGVELGVRPVLYLYLGFRFGFNIGVKVPKLAKTE